MNLLAPGYLFPPIYDSGPYVAVVESSVRQAGNSSHFFATVDEGRVLKYNGVLGFRKANKWILDLDKEMKRKFL